MGTDEEHDRAPRDPRDRSGERADDSGRLLLGLVGGSGKDDKAAHKSPTRVSPIAALQSAEKSTDGADSAKVESTTTMGTLMSMKSDGVMGWGDGLTGDMTITYTGGTMADTMRKAGVTSMQARYLSDAYYAKMGETFARQVNGKHWIRYGYDDLAKLGAAPEPSSRTRCRTARRTSR